MISFKFLELMYRTLVNFGIDENRDQMLEDLMRGPVSEALGISTKVQWGSQSGNTFTAQMGDFMKPVIHIGKRKTSLCSFFLLKIFIYFLILLLFS